MSNSAPFRRLPLRPASLSLAALLVGTIAGVGAVAFRGLIALIHNLMFLGQFSVHYDANVHTAPSPWGPWVILVPVAGAMGVAFLVKNFAPEAKGHGVPEVMDAIYYQRGAIRPVVAIVKSLASALSIGSGGSVGREGPIIQIGSSFGSTLGQVIPMPAWQRITLVAAGAAGGIAATFNTPIGGVLFAVEILMHEVSVRTLVPVAISTATATYVGRVVFGDYPSFVIPQFHELSSHVTHPEALLFYVVLGVLMGLVSTLYIRSIYAFEDFFDTLPGNYYLRHGAGMLLVGIGIYVMMATTGNYYIESVGYSTVQDILSGTIGNPWFLLLLAGLKLLATCLTLGSGASGGIFSPALYLGATLGGAYGLLLARVFPQWVAMPAAFAVAGMAGLVGGATGAAMAAIVMIFEMTLDYNVIVPMTITVALSYQVRQALSAESIYTMKLARRGHHMPDALQANFHQLMRAGDLMDTGLVILPATGTLRQLTELRREQPAISCYLIAEGEQTVGYIARDDVWRLLETHAPDALLGEVARRDYVGVGAQLTLFGVVTEMRSQEAAVALVSDRAENLAPKEVRGVITREQIAATLVQAVELFGQ
ncbi:MAG TPA: chloride channel protein [Pirellulales bacterium]|nr:chloride channel protein [Pirellulales bacterium]